MADKRVRDIQTRLVELGYSVGTKGVDGMLGNDTSSAINAALDELETYKLGEEPETNEDVEVDNGEPKTEHFKLSEYDISPDGKKITEELYPNVQKLFEMLEIIRHEAGDRPLYVSSSGYRSQSYNDKKYNKKDKPSMHCYGGAADIHVSGMSQHDLGVLCKKLYDKKIIGGLGLGDRCIHVDIRNWTGLVNGPYVNNGYNWFYNGYSNYSEWFRGTK